MGCSESEVKTAKQSASTPQKNNLAKVVREEIDTTKKLRYKPIIKTNMNKSDEIKLYEQGYELLSTYQFQGAINYFDKCIELNPLSYNAWNAKGVAIYSWKTKCIALYFLDGLIFDDDIKHFNKALEIKPDFGAAWYNRGLWYHQKRKFKEAITDFKKALELNYEQVPKQHIFYNIAISHYYNKDYNGAIKYAEESLKLNPRHTGTLRLISELKPYNFNKKN